MTAAASLVGEILAEAVDRQATGRPLLTGIRVHPSTFQRIVGHLDARVDEMGHPHFVTLHTPAGPVRLSPDLVPVVDHLYPDPPASD